jgi:hypothetical protein
LLAATRETFNVILSDQIAWSLSMKYSLQADGFRLAYDVTGAGPP